MVHLWLINCLLLADTWQMCSQEPLSSVFGSFVQGGLFLAAAVLYLCGRHEYLGFLVTCLALSWVNLLYYSRGLKHMGIYSVMIQKVTNGGGQPEVWRP